MTQQRVKFVAERVLWCNVFQLRVLCGSVHLAVDDANNYRHGCLSLHTGIVKNEISET